MKTFRYMNAVLTVIAVLLTLNLWTMWTAGTTPANTSLDFTTPAQAQGLANAGSQRQEMITAIKAQTVAITEMSKTLKSGQVRVRIEAGK